MEIPQAVVEAVKAKPQATIVAKPKRKGVVKTKAIIRALGNGLRTVESIANATGIDSQYISAQLWRLKTDGKVIGVKTDGVRTKYYLTDKTMADKSKKPTALKKAHAPHNHAKIEQLRTDIMWLEKEKGDLQQELDSYKGRQDRMANLENTLKEKDKEIWNLECEVFDKKAIIKYLEEKLFTLGVR